MINYTACVSLYLCVYMGVYLYISGNRYYISLCVTCCCQSLENNWYASCASCLCWCFYHSTMYLNVVYRYYRKETQSMSAVPLLVTELILTIHFGWLQLIMVLCNSNITIDTLLLLK